MNDKSKARIKQRKEWEVRKIKKTAAVNKQKSQNHFTTIIEYQPDALPWSKDHRDRWYDPTWKH